MDIRVPGETGLYHQKTLMSVMDLSMDGVSERTCEVDREAVLGSALHERAEVNHTPLR